MLDKVTASDVLYLDKFNIKNIDTYTEPVSSLKFIDENWTNQRTHAVVGRVLSISKVRHIILSILVVVFNHDNLSAEYCDAKGSWYGYYVNG